MRKYLLFIIIIALAFCKKGVAQKNTQNVTDTLVIDNQDMERRVFPFNFKEAYSGEEYTYESDKVSKGWFTRFKEWFAKKIKEWFDFEGTTEANDIADFLIKLFYVLIIIAVIFIIVKAILNNEGRWVFGKKSDRKIIKVDDIETNLHIVDFKSLIKEAVTTNNYRLAIRYYYLWVLKELTKKEYIEYDVEKTNNDYLNEIDNKDLKANFSYASYLYNYIWYGEFKVEDKEFKKALSVFKSLINTLV